MNNIKLVATIADPGADYEFRIFAHDKLSDAEIGLAIRKKSLWSLLGTFEQYGRTWTRIRVDAIDGWETAPTAQERQTGVLF